MFDVLGCPGRDRIYDERDEARFQATFKDALRDYPMLSRITSPRGARATYTLEEAVQLRGECIRIKESLDVNTPDFTFWQRVAGRAKKHLESQRLATEFLSKMLEACEVAITAGKCLHLEDDD